MFPSTFPVLTSHDSRCASGHPLGISLSHNTLFRDFKYSSLFTPPFFALRSLAKLLPSCFAFSTMRLIASSPINLSAIANYSIIFL